MHHYAVCTLDSGGWDGTGTVTSGDDCDDQTATTNPGASEFCSGDDDDCDGDTDEGYLGSGTPIYTVNSQTTGTCVICQDQPDAFSAGACQSNVQIWVR